jgi:hypothetical protein
MPENGCYLLSVKSARPGLPKTERDAVERIIDSLPAWLFVATGLSAGDNECVVQVNKIDYLNEVVSMWVDRWRRSLKDHPGFLGHASFESDDVVDRLQDLACREIKLRMFHSK